jgi:hypothetical protein
MTLEALILTMEAQLMRKPVDLDACAYSFFDDLFLEVEGIIP